MSYYKRSEKEPRRARKSAGKSWGDNAPLTNPQKGKLSMYAREAWDALDRAGLVDGEDFDDWKHTQTEIACGVNSFRLATNKQFRSIKGRFLRLAGKEAEAKKTLSTTGRVAGSKEQHDTHENRELKFKLIMGLVSSGKIDAGLVTLKAQDKFGTMDLNTLTNKQLEGLYLTLKGRARAPRAN